MKGVEERIKSIRFGSLTVDIRYSRQLEPSTDACKPQEVVQVPNNLGVSTAGRRKITAATCNDCSLPLDS